MSISVNMIDELQLSDKQILGNKKVAFHLTRSNNTIRVRIIENKTDSMSILLFDEKDQKNPLVQQVSADEYQRYRFFSVANPLFAVQCIMCQFILRETNAKVFDFDFISNKL